MFVRFPIILARPTSLRGSLSPDLWQKVIGRTPSGTLWDLQSPAVENTTLGSLVSAVLLVQKAMEKYPAGPAGLRAVSCPPPPCAPCSVLSPCLRPRVPTSLDAQPALPELYFSMWPIASMLRWAEPLVKGF